MRGFDFQTTVSYLPVFGTSMSVPAAFRACRTAIKSASASGVDSPDKKSRIQSGSMLTELNLGSDARCTPGEFFTSSVKHGSRFALARLKHRCSIKYELLY
jgi:hypothetical protein